MKSALAGAEYRAQIKALIQRGRMREAMTHEIKDIRRIAATKYNQAIREMLAYAKSVGLLNK